MSYEIIKSITFNQKNQRITMRASSNNVHPRTYELWSPTDHGYDYYDFQKSLASCLFGGEAQFQPSCKSKAKKAYDNVNAKFGLRSTSNGVWHQVRRMFPFDYDCEKRKWLPEIDTEMKEKYDEFRNKWEAAYLVELNWLLSHR